VSKFKKASALVVAARRPRNGNVINKCVLGGIGKLVGNAAFIEKDYQE
jgi:hypothetical protein